MKKYNCPVEGKYVKNIKKGQPTGIDSARYIRFEYEDEKHACGLPFYEEQCEGCIDYNKCKGDIK
jgi:hypothetical protein